WLTHLEIGLFGEPTLHPQFEDMVALASNSGLSVAIFTNGVLLNPERARKLIMAGPASITFSMDGASVADYERLHAGANADVVTKNLLNFLKIRKELRRKRPFVIVRGLSILGLEGQRDAHSKHFRKLGADQVVWLQVNNWSGSLGSPERTLNLPAAKPKTHQCLYPWLMLCVDWDGIVLPCCEDFNAKNKIGHLNETPLKELWTGKTISALRQSLLTRNRNHICSTTGCADCILLRRPSHPLNSKLQLMRTAFGEFWVRFVDPRSHP
ncbi:MAG: SPASM domain-containing protein, partial [bacterium]